MKRISLLLLLIGFGCKEVSFPEPQPAGTRSIAEVPDKLRGNYLYADEQGERDTIVITKNSFFAKGDPKDTYTLSDSVVMKSYKGYYFISKNSGVTWNLRLIRQEKSGDITYLAMNDDHFDEFLTKLSKEIKIDSAMRKNEKVYEIKPTPKQLMELIDKGFFDKHLVLKKMK